ncbi:MAG: proton-conducting transporter membrane subunit, partial [Kineosporiaceae bacterium]
VHAGGVAVAAGGLLRVDALTAYLLAVVGVVALNATWAGLEPRAAASAPDGWLAGLVCLFVAAMSLALLADNLGVMWVAIEGTTITTAFLVGYRGGRRAVEAAWKYVVLGSVGVAVAFLGIVLLYAASDAGGVATLSWAAMTAHPLGLDRDLTRVGAALAALGLATKAGLAPMHTWLPDAHSQAPAPVSGLMSGVLLSVAFYAILRIKAISDAVLGPGQMRGLLVSAGLLSLLVAAGLILTQRDYKRMLAYSSIEHMGLLALGAAVSGPVATAAVLLHILGHGLAKSTLFVLAGRLLAAEGSTTIADVRDLLGRRPAIAVPWLVAMAALLGLPPSGLFFTEVAIIGAGFDRGLGWVMAVALALLLIAFTGLARHTLSMTLSRPGAQGIPGAGQGRAGPAGPLLPVALALTVVAGIGFAAWPLRGVLAGAVAALGVAS